MTVRIVRNAAGIKAAREAGAYGLLNFGFAVEGAWKADAVVRGGHRSFMTDLTKAGTPRVGGTFRRSIHTAAYLDGQRIGGEMADENGEAPPNYPAGKGMVVYVGSNCGYGGPSSSGPPRCRPGPQPCRRCSDSRARRTRSLPPAHESTSASDDPDLRRSAGGLP